MGYMRAFGLLVFGLICTSAFAQDHALLIDRSGSMKSYYETGLIDDLGRAVQNVLRTHGKTHVIAFGSDVTSVNDIGEIKNLPLGSSTYLDRAIDHVIQQRYAIAWMITDNIQDQP